MSNTSSNSSGEAIGTLSKLDEGARVSPPFSALAQAGADFFNLDAIAKPRYHRPMLASLVIICGLLFAAALFGPRLFPHSNKILATLFGLLTLLAAQSIFQTVWYYADGRLGYQSDLASLAVAILVIVLITTRKRLVRAEELEQLHDPVDHVTVGTAGSMIGRGLFVAIPALIAVIFVLWHAFHAGTTDAIRTPWPLLPHGTLAALSLISVAAWLAAWKIQSRILTATLSILGLISLTFITILIYKLGFGFDGFLHRASEQILLHTGTLTPKPLYYIGQYVLVTWFARIFSAPIVFFDLSLVPIAAGFLPLGLLFAFEKRTGAWAAVLLFALLPLGAFISTTPQSFAYVLGLLAILLALAVERRSAHPVAPLLLAVWSVATHPLAGLPFLGAVVTLLWIERTRSHVNTLVRTIIASVLILATAISVPLAFYLNGLRSGAHIAWDFSRLLDFTIYQTALSQLNAPATHVALWATWAAFVNFLFPFVLIACTFVACIRDHERRSSWIALLFLAGGMAVSGFILRTTGEFTFLVDYERGNYADRLFLISELLLLAPALAGATLLAKRIVQRPATNIAAFLIFLVGWTSAQAYLALPRHDATIVGHGWSVGQADFEAVRWIDRDAAGKTYTVLADQSVSAAAVESFGFKRYVGDVFYYPIPTGGSLYEVYLRAVGSEPTRDIIKEAATLGNSALVYVVLNDYWWDATNVAENLKAIADRTYEIQNGKDTIYRFDFKSDKKR